MTTHPCGVSSEKKISRSDLILRLCVSVLHYCRVGVRQMAWSSIDSDMHCCAESILGCGIFVLNHDIICML